MLNGIYFIGGASASGKSEVAKRLQEIFSTQIVVLDDIYNSLSIINDETERITKTQDCAYLKIEELLNSEFSGIIEGGWISPLKANELKNKFGDRFNPVYCGYPNAKVEDRVTKIVSDNKHWLKWKTEKERTEWVKKQIRESGDYKDQCEQYEMPFFDFSDFETGSNSLFENYKIWRRM